MHSVPILLRAALAGLALAAAAAPGAAGAAAETPRYRVEFARPGFQGYDLNNLGEVVGLLPTGRLTYDAYVYNGGALTEIELAGVGLPDRGLGFAPRYINDRGDIAGTSSKGGGDGILYNKNSGRVTNLTAGWGEQRVSVFADALNNRGKVMGSVITLEANDRFWFHDGSTTRTSPLEQVLADDIRRDLAIAPVDLNDREVILGFYVPKDSGLDVPFLYQQGDTAVTRLSTDGGFRQGTALNNAGQVAGFGQDPSGTRMPFLYAAGTAVSLGSLGGVHATEGGGEATALNEQGWVVGRAATSATDMAGFLYRDGRMFNLNDLISADAAARWDIDTALKVNDRGQILAYAFSAGSHDVDTLLLTPVAEPQTWALMLAGVGVLGAAVRRRRASRRA